MYARVVTFDHSFGRYKDVNSLESNWETECMYVLCDANNIVEMGGLLERGN